MLLERKKKLFSLPEFDWNIKIIHTPAEIAEQTPTDHLTLSHSTGMPQVRYKAVTTIMAITGCDGDYLKAV